MKTKYFLFVFILFFNTVIYCQNYYVQNISKLEVFFDCEKIDFSKLEIFCDENNLSKDFQFLHDRKLNLYYVATRNSNYDIFYLCKVVGKKILFDSPYIIKLPYDASLRYICNNKILFDLGNENIDFCIYDLLTMNTREIVIKKEDFLRVTIGFTEDKIFFINEYYDIVNDAFFSYHLNLQLKTVNSSGTCIIGIDEDNYIKILDLHYGNVKKLNIKRKLKKSTKYKAESLYYLEDRVLYFSKDPIINISDFFDRFFLSGYKKRIWYEFNLQNNKIKKIKQPTDYVDIY